MTQFLTTGHAWFNRDSITHPKMADVLTYPNNLTSALMTENIVTVDFNCPDRPTPPKMNVRPWRDVRYVVKRWESCLRVSLPLTDGINSPTDPVTANVHNAVFWTSVQLGRLTEVYFVLFIRIKRRVGKELRACHLDELRRRTIDAAGTAKPYAGSEQIFEKSDA